MKDALLALTRCALAMTLLGAGIAAEADRGTLDVASGASASDETTIASPIAPGPTEKRLTAPAPPPPPTHATVVVTVTSRNGGELLARTLVELGNLAKSPQYQALLRRGDPALVELACASSARRDPSGRVFDLAVCAQAWPALDRAPLAKTFEEGFAAPVQRDGIDAFPDVRVTSFEFQHRLRPDQLGKDTAKIIDTKQDEPKLTDRVSTAVCDPKVTFIERGRCKIQLRSRLGLFKADIYASQTGYRVTLAKDVPVEMAERLRSDLLKRVTSRVKSNSDEYRVVAFPRSSTAKSESRGGDLAGPATQIQAFWSARGMTTAALDLADGAATPPIVLVFDQIDPDNAAEFQGWMQSLRDNRLPVTPGICPTGLAPDAHARAVGSILFPEDIEALLRPRAAEGQNKPADVDGYFLSKEHFAGLQTVAGNQSWLAQGSFRESDPRIVAVATFSDQVRSIQSVASSLATDLSQNRSRILVVAAAERTDPPEKSSKIQDYGEAPPTRNAKTIEDACKLGSWPSCLGRHPQVVVVAPSIQSDGVRKLFREDDYVLGASHVKLAAPGAAIPVLVPCAAKPGAAPTWTLQSLDGTSYAAPLVGLVLSRLIQIGPNRLDDVPELAVWRLLATTDPLAPSPSGVDVTRKVQFGELNAVRALTGVTEKESGENEAATLYERDDKGAHQVAQAVVVPFLWSDHDQAVRVNASGVAAKGGIEIQPRGFLTITPLADDGTPGKPDVLVFRRIVRLARRASDTVAGRPTFDAYYVAWQDDTPDLKTLVVRRRVWLGSMRSDDRGQTGFCRWDGDVQKGEVKATLAEQSEPACLYAWRRGGTEGFVPLDLSKVDDIVFPILHSRADWIDGIAPVDLHSVTKAGSPWRYAFCNARPRRAAWKYLEERRKTIDLVTACRES